MNKRNSVILGLLLVILMIEILIFAPKELNISSSEEPEASTVATEGTDRESSGQVGRNVHLVETKGRGKEWELWADTALRSNDSEEVRIEKVRAMFFADNGVTYTVTGAKGQVNPEKNQMSITGDVITRSSNGYVFRTERVTYDPKNRQLLSPEPVKMTGPDDDQGSRIKLTGASMTADLVSNELAISRNVRGRKVIRDGKVANIRSQRALFSGRTNLAQFFGNVVIDIDTMRITGPEARFAYDATTESFESIMIGGGARLTDTDRFATSDSVNVNFKEDRLVFSGAPRVVQNGDELTGDEIVFSDGGRKVRVSNAKAQIDSGSLSEKSE